MRWEPWRLDCPSSACPRGRPVPQRRTIASAGAGLALMPREATAEAVSDAVLRLLTDPSFGMLRHS